MSDIGEVVEGSYNDLYPYIMPFTPHKKLRGVHYFPIYGKNGKILYWVRRDMLYPNDIPKFFFRIPRFVEEDLILFDEDPSWLPADFLNQPDFDTALVKKIMLAGDKLRAARMESYLERERQEDEIAARVAERIARQNGYGHRLKGGGNAGWTILAFLIVLVIGFYWSATVYVFPKVVIRGITKSTNISLPWGNVCRVPSGSSAESIASDASQLFGTSVDLEPGYGSIQQVKSGRCLDGVILTGATIKAVRGSASVLVSMESVADVPPGLPEVQKGQIVCIFPLPAHPGKGLCQNVGPIKGDVQLIADTAYWVFVNEPDLKRKDEGGEPPPSTQPTAVVK